MQENVISPEAAGTTASQIQTETLQIVTSKRVQLLNLTAQVDEQVRRSGLRDGLAFISSLHTTLALFLNEFQPALLDDIRFFLEQTVVRDRYWKHNDPIYSDCDRSNADSHLRAMLLGHSLILPVRNGRLVLGAFQSVILAELDGPRQRTLQFQLLGTR